MTHLFFRRIWGANTQSPDWTSTSLQFFIVCLGVSVTTPPSDWEQGHTGPGFYFWASPTMLSKYVFQEQITHPRPLFCVLGG